MEEMQNSKGNLKKYDLAERTLQFAKKCRQTVKCLSKTIGNIEDGKQLIRSSGSVHANYIEANESLSKKDFYHRFKLCRKEAKESHSWLYLLDLSGNEALKKEQQDLMGEALELTKIFGSIVSKSPFF